MSDKTEEEIEIERARKGKRIMRPEDETEEETGEQNPASFPSELDSANLSLSYEMYRREGGSGSLDDFMKQQQYALDRAQKSHLGNPFLDEMEVDAEGNKKTSDFESYSTDSDADKEDTDPIEKLIFELEIQEKDRLVIPYALASQHFPPLIINPNIEETLCFQDPHRKIWKMTLIYDTNTHSFVITNGWKHYLDYNRLSPSDIIRVYLPIPQENDNDFYIQHQRSLGQSLFEVEVPRCNRLPIPYTAASKYFNPSEPPPPPDHLTEHPLNLTDLNNCRWEMRYVFFEDEGAYIIFRGWDKYAAHRELKYEDKLRFYKDRFRISRNNFIISTEPAVDCHLVEDYDDELRCIRDHLLFELDLREVDVKYGMLKMPGVEFPFKVRGKEMVKLTDQNGKDWYSILVYQSGLKEYMIIDGWERIAKEHKLEAGDMVRFFVPVSAEHNKHFLLEIEKKKKNDTEKKEGGSGLGKPEGCAGPSCKG